MTTNLTDHDLLEKDKKNEPVSSQLQGVVNEPTAIYGTMEHNTIAYLKSIPQNTMQTLVDLSIEDYEMGRCTPHSQMDSWIKKRMGWK